MRSLVQSVALLLALLMLAPPAVASARCIDCAHEPAREMECCAGMHGMTMPMQTDAQAPDSSPQLTLPACCATTSVELALPASLSELMPHQILFSLALIGAAEPISILSRQHDVEQFPPGGRPLRATLTRLCTFLI